MLAEITTDPEANSLQIVVDTDGITPTDFVRKTNDFEELYKLIRSKTVGKTWTVEEVKGAIVVKVRFFMSVPLSKSYSVGILASASFPATGLPQVMGIIQPMIKDGYEEV